MDAHDVKSLLDQLPDEEVAQELKRKHVQMAKLIDATLNALIDNPRNKTLAENLKTYNTIYENNLARIMSYINANSAVRSIVSEQVTPTLGVLNAQYQQLLGEVKNALKTVIAQPDKAQAVISQLQNKEVAYSGLMNRVMLELAENLYKALR